MHAGLTHLLSRVERAEHEAKDEGQRLLRLINEISERVGGGAVVTHDGKGGGFVHPELARELKKPENQKLSEVLVTVVRGARPPTED
jgi:hypothetical protein